MKCFITKLEGSVTNDSLPKIGELRYLIKKTSDVRNIFLFDGVADKAVTSTVSGKNYFTDVNGTVNNGKSISRKTTQDSNRYFKSLEDGYYTISQKYDIGRILIRNYKDMEIDISDFLYCKNLTSLSVSNSSVSGDIASLNSLVNLTSLNVSNTGVYGDCKNLFDGLVTAGKRNGILKIWTVNKEVSYNGKKPTKRVWSATFNNGSYSVENTDN